MSQFVQHRDLLLFLGAIALGAIPATGVQAQELAASPSVEARYPTAHAQRPLTLPAGRIRADVDQTVLDFAASSNVETPVWSLSFGGAVGVGAGFELGVSTHRAGPSLPRHGIYPAGALALVLAPEGDFGDVPIYVRERLVRTDRVEAVIDVGVRAPVKSDLGFDFGVLTRIFVHPSFTIDVGAGYLMIVQTHEADACASGTACDGTSVLSMWVPLSGIVQLHELVFVAIHTGIELDHHDIERWSIPLGAELGLTVPGANDLLDLRLSATLPRLARPFADDRTGTDLYQIQLAAQGHFGL